jgi:hypothetical protein
LASGLLFATFASLGMLQKVSTALPVLLVMGAIVLLSHVRARGGILPDLRTASIIFVSFAMPFLMTLLWFAYANHVRDANPMIGNNESMLQSWFGGNRVNFDFYRMIFWDRMLSQNAGGFLGLALLAIGIVVGPQRVRWIILVCLLACFLTSFLFMRHHHFIFYYQTANTIFLLAGLAIAIYSLSDRLRITYAAPLLCAAVVALNLYSYQTGYAKYVKKVLTPRNNTTLAVSDIIRRYTSPDSAILVFGLMSTGSLKPISAWSSEVAYYSERKSLTLADAESSAWSDPAAFLGGKSLSAMVFCSPKKNRKRYKQLLEKYGGSLPPSLYKVRDCYLWLPGAKSVRLPNQRMLTPRQTLE